MHLWLILCFALLSASGLYFATLGLPIVQVAGAVGLLGLAPMQRLRLLKKLWHQTSLLLGSLTLSAVILLWTLWGAFYVGDLLLKTPLGILLGIALFALIVLLRPIRPALMRSLTAVLVVHLVTLLVQIVWYIVNGQFLDYLEPLTGEPSRYSYGGYGLALTRFTGLFQESAQYSAFAFFGVTARLLDQRWKLQWLDWLLVSSMIATLSLYGMLLACLVVTVVLIKTHRRWLPAGLLMLFMATAWIFQPEDSDVLSYLIMRTTAGLEDSSGSHRLDMGDWWDWPLTAKALGFGTAHDEETRALANNGLSYALAHWGIIGAALLLLIWHGIIHSYSMNRWAWIFVLMTLLGAPPFTNLMWWAWLGLLVIATPEGARAGLARIQAGDCLPCLRKGPDVSRAAGTSE